jgi:hypothetical protein
MDYGWSAPSVFIGGARDGDGRVWLYRELTMRQTPEKEQARRIIAAAPEVRDVAADPAMWGKAGSADPPANQMIGEGLALRKADNDRLGGKSRWHSFLAEAPACGYHRALGWDTCPGVHILDGTCPELVRTLPNLPRDPNRPEDVDSDAEDHWYDAGRYLFMSIGGGPKFYIEPEPDPDAPVPLQGVPETAIGQPFGGRIAVMPNPDGTSPWMPGSGGGVVISE